MIFVKTTRHWTRDSVNRDRSRVYLFGDNLDGWGNAGQACIRGLPNAIGIPTKKSPSRKESAYMTDAEYESNCAAIDAAFDKIPATSTVVVYHPEIGKGLADMPRRCPLTYAYLQDVLKVRQSC